MIDRLRREWHGARGALSEISPDAWRAIVVMLAATLLVLLQIQLGGRSVYRSMDNPLGFADPELGAWAWWFGLQGVTGFIVPVLILLAAFRWRPKQAGLGLGDWKLAIGLTIPYLVLVVIGTWVLSDGDAFQAQYPHYAPAKFDWTALAIYEGLFLFYWIGWEYLWRGFVLFGTAPAVGAPLAIVIQTVPFAILHAEKPVAEAYLSVLGGVALGALVWRCRSFWIAVPLHAAQMLILDVWCTLRARSGAEGIGLDALQAALGG